MTLSSPSLRRFVKRALVDATGTESPDHGQLASAFGSLCTHLCERLQPVFGTSAVNALFLRAQHVASAEFPWLNDVLSKSAAPCGIESVGVLAELEVSMVEEGLAAVLAHNIGLLSTFVGDDLVLPLVEKAWGGGAPPLSPSGPRLTYE